MKAVEKATDMETVRLCHECGAPLEKDAPEGLCPKCLVKVGLMNELSTTPRGTVVVTESEVLGKPTTQPAITGPGSSQQFGGYRTVRPLGKGGMGAVYEAEDIESGRRVALKVLTHSLDSPEARKRFLREGRLAASVNHPNCVYIYGTEEIDGTPVITMELVTGGTLQQRVKQNGPLPITEAVDTILQVIAGLEAAQAKGVLHRDIKPANCFIEKDGTIKVGDFGLSISTLARGESILTVSGAFMGTPAYSSPEQLRGDELDVRSDIYAVGVTLYYLLTAKTPFEGDNLVKLLATVLERPAESPKKLRPEMPGDLAKVVLRCLAKQPSERFKNYAEFRRALSPFSANARIPATLGIRFVAGFIDYMFLNIVGLLLANVAFTMALDPAGYPMLDFIVGLIGISLVLAYFSVLEGLGGASLGKKALRLRVVGPGGNHAGIPKALLRSLIFPTLVFVLLYGFNPSSVKGKNNWLKLSVCSLSVAAIFSTARRRNGFAGLHDLASDTRVVLAPRYHQTRGGVPTAEDPLPATENLVQVGPYHVLHSLSTTETHELLLGYDTRLLRKVWILKSSRVEPPLSPARCDLTRPGRLRWLSGKRAPDACWDAFEAMPGKPLLHLVTQRQPWSAVRHWLHDLAEELGAGIKDQSLPPVLGLDRIWITTDGRAKLLEFPAPGAPATGTDASANRSTSAPHHTEAAVLLFLKQIAVSALQGCVMNLDEARNRSIQVPLPLHARTFITNVSTRSTVETLSDELKPLLEKDPVVSSGRRRLGMWLSFWLVCTGLGLTGFMFGSSGMMKAVQSEPDLELLRRSLARIALL